MTLLILNWRAAYHLYKLKKCLTRQRFLCNSLVKYRCVKSEGFRFDFSREIRISFVIQSRQNEQHLFLKTTFISPNLFIHMTLLALPLILVVSQYARCFSQSETTLANTANEFLAAKLVDSESEIFHEGFSTFSSRVPLSGKRLGIFLLILKP